ncbi:MAG: protein kinase [Deltaproteobacteria bacterium]|nr:protein kinase [Deltaproteobacteria bacterium]
MLCFRCGSAVDERTLACPNCGQDLSSGSVAAPLPFSDLEERIRKSSGDWSTPAAYHVGQVLVDRYEISDVIGVGPVGTVYKALDLDVEIDVALKVVNEHLLPAEADRVHFVRTIRGLKSLVGDHIVRYFDVGRDGDRCFYVTQFLEGLSLRRIIDLRREKQQRFSLDEVAPIASQLCQALIDGAGAVHGGIRPQNIVILPDQLKVTDFALASALPTGAYRANDGRDSLCYVAPEVKAGRRPTIQSDIYSVGVILAELISGRYPGSDVVPLKDLVGENIDYLETVLGKAHAALPKERYGSAAELRVALSDAFGATTVRRHAGEIVESTGTAGDDQATTVGPAKESTQVLDVEDLDFDSAQSSNTDEDVLSEPTPQVELMARRESTHRLRMDEIEEIAAAQPVRRAKPAVEADGADDAGVVDATAFSDAVEVQGEIASPSPRPSRAELAVEQESVEVDVEVPILTLGYEAQADPLEQETTAAVAPEVLHHDAVPPPLATSAVRRQVVLPARRRHNWPVIVTLMVAMVALGAALAAVLYYQTQRWKRRGDLPVVAERSAATESPTAPPEPTAVALRDSNDGSANVGHAASTAAKPVARASKVGRMASQKKVTLRRATSPPRSGSTEPAPPAASAPDGAIAPSPSAVATRQAPQEPGAAAPRRELGAERRPEAKQSPASSSPHSAASKTLASSVGAKDKCFSGMVHVAARSGGFCIDRYEAPGRGRTPQVTSLAGAVAYCSRRGVRLCNKAEWLAACGGVLPYGGAYQSDRCNTEGGALVPAGSRRACRSPYGVYDMSGNVAEWVAGGAALGGDASAGAVGARCAASAAAGARKGVRCCADLDDWE